jgi:hypothetical protein
MDFSMNSPYDLGNVYEGPFRIYYVNIVDSDKCVPVADDESLEKIDPTSLVGLKACMFWNGINGDFSKYENLKCLIIVARPIVGRLVVSNSLEFLSITYSNSGIEGDIDLSGCAAMEHLRIEREVKGKLILPTVSLKSLSVGDFLSRIREITTPLQCKMLTQMSIYLGGIPEDMPIPEWIAALEIRGGRAEIVDLSKLYQLKYLLILTEDITLLILPSHIVENYEYRINAYKAHEKIKIVGNQKIEYY